MRMNNSVKIITTFSRNNVIKLSVLRDKNFPLFKYTMNNYQRVVSSLREYGYYLLDDLTTLHNIVNIKLYLLYHYGESVSLTLLRSEDRTIYNYLSKRGSPYDLLKKLGFEVTHEIFVSKEYLLSSLKRLAGPNKIIDHLEPSLYRRVYYRSKKEGYLSINDYLSSLGYKLNKLNEEEILRLRKKGLTFKQIGEELGISTSYANKLYRKLQDKDG